MAFFTAKGRLRRRQYLLRLVLLYAMAIAFYALPSLIPDPGLQTALHFLAGAGIAVAWYLVIIQALLRLHDLDLSAWWALVGLLPVVSYVLGGGLQLVQGSIGPNRFGPDPKRPAWSPGLTGTDSTAT
ncbi:DUF805 domain-containing protein [Hymenobacter glacialis]|uniref:DUF805 domain-containing protein n=1 Tax=Hymenobacter glacialis TaxID=1908236 RepID=A0A1G1ST02_9BACT|nr:DUF805 domain-containing protein [Hymenobacter glacialis]OGX81755.1 hypothetical protein BEN48_05870 [Hymenobacter glacialis]